MHLRKFSYIFKWFHIFAQTFKLTSNEFYMNQKQLKWLIKEVTGNNSISNKSLYLIVCLRLINGATWSTYYVVHYGWLNSSLVQFNCRVHWIFRSAINFALNWLMLMNSFVTIPTTTCSFVFIRSHTFSCVFKRFHIFAPANIWLPKKYWPEQHNPSKMVVLASTWIKMTNWA